MLPADQLVKLNIAAIIYSSSFEPSVYTDFLRRCSSLVTLEISPPASLEFRSPPAPVSLPVLKSLRLTFFSSFYGLQGVSSLLRLLIVPLLEDLTYSLRHVDFQEFVIGITALRDNLPTSNLKSLTLEMGYMANADLTLVLGLFPAITSFRLSDIGFDTNHLFRAMTYKKNSNDNSVLIAEDCEPRTGISRENKLPVRADIYDALAVRGRWTPAPGRCRTHGHREIGAGVHTRNQIFGENRRGPGAHCGST
ncbi:hypothetical protein EV359DRAFT_85181 [Lentinula novae-zelandiae]|nr:hypothetical protein EV359DRAFT_85181 [Lentinula novae-zelandiae]